MGIEAWTKVSLSLLACMPLRALARTGSWNVQEPRDGMLSTSRNEGNIVANSYRVDYSQLVPGDEPGTYKWETLSSEDPQTVNSLMDSVMSLFNMPFVLFGDESSTPLDVQWSDAEEVSKDPSYMVESMSGEKDMHKLMQMRMGPAMKDCMKHKQMGQGGADGYTYSWESMTDEPVSAKTTWNDIPSADADKMMHSTNGVACLLFALCFLVLAGVGLVTVVNGLLSYCCGGCCGSEEEDAAMREPLLDRQFLVEGTIDAPYVHGSFPSGENAKPVLVNVVTHEPLKPMK